MAKKVVPKSKNKSKHTGESKAEKRVADFYLKFKSEAPFIRDIIVRDLPAYNMLLSLRAENFKDIALSVIAKQRGIDFDPLNPPMPDCPVCGKHDMVRTQGKTRYWCRRCRTGFRATHNSLISEKKLDDMKVINVLISLLEGHGAAKTCRYCNISEMTYYRLRNKLLYAMQIVLSDVKLYGVIQADCAFVRVSYKGLDLEESEFDETSVLYNKYAFIPREKRERGGAYSQVERNANSICILSLMDEYGHVANIFCGTGLASIRTLKAYVPEGKILTKVPDESPFYLLKKNEQKTETKPGDASLLVVDKEAALKGYADAIGLNCEPHVYRSKGVQRALPEGAHNIQRINSLHSRLKLFLREHPVSSKYLPGYLTLFDFKEMTATSKDAVNRLIEVLATPGLGREPEFFQNLFTVPNYLEQWFAGDHPLKKLEYRKLLAFYLYDHIRNKGDYPGIEITMQYIEKETGYSSKHIRASYQNLLNAGYRDMILTYFGEVVESKDGTARPMINVPPIIPLLHDEWAAYLRGEKGPRPKFINFAKEKIQQHSLSYSVNQLSYWFKRVEELKICSPLPSKAESVPPAPDIPEISYVLYDEWAEIQRGRSKPQYTLKQFYLDCKEQQRFQFSEATLRSHFHSIETLGYRKPLPKVSKKSKEDIPPTSRDNEICDAFDSFWNKLPPDEQTGRKKSEIRGRLGKKYSLSEPRIYEIVRDVHRYRQKQAGLSVQNHESYSKAEIVDRVERSSDENGRISLVNYNPAAAARWHPTKNGSLTPDQVTYGSSRRVWWKCPSCGQEWQSEVRSQARKISCTYCSSIKKWEKEGFIPPDISDEILSQLHPTKNSGLDLEQLSYRTRASLWWVCDAGHEYQETVKERALGRGCPHCAAAKGYKDLAAEYPELATQWHPTKNGDLLPSQVKAGSKKKVWWLGECGHEWEAVVKARALHNTGCPYCSTRNRRVLVGVNDLATLKPELAAQWHPTKNGELTPSMVKLKSNKDAWWVCEKGHEWKTLISVRTEGSGCPYCDNRLALPGFNDLKTVAPEVASQWHPTKNGELTPEHVLPGSSKKVWWLCPDCHHEWEATVGSYTKKKSGCPECAKKRRESGRRL